MKQVLGRWRPDSGICLDGMRKPHTALPPITGGQEVRSGYLLFERENSMNSNVLGSACVPSSFFRIYFNNRTRTPAPTGTQSKVSVQACVQLAYGRLGFTFLSF